MASRTIGYDYRLDSVLRSVRPTDCVHRVKGQKSGPVD
ncbi:S26-RNase [Escherichia phage IMM-002]|uniref:S26-RNase n=1 Tax=Escherichia phage IMM-002 TaxID=2041760 RepID=A0A384WXY1_9CAUD|nr:S26-RNase [Escherichia phage IMM-002]ATI17009.1 S26-RNase [Escherichia phage IMM-002]